MGDNLTTYSLAALGDLMFDSPFIRSDNRPIESVIEALVSNDHTFANLEVALTHRTEGLDKLLWQRCDPALAPELKRAGISVVTLANNHAMDFGEPGLSDMIQALDSAGVPH